jgi:DNA-binding NarL/FixJ family response regulator
MSGPVLVRVHALDPISEAGMPLMLVVGQLDSRALITVVESGVRAVTRRCEVTPLRLSELLHAAAANRGELPPDLLGQLLDQVGQLNRTLLGPRSLALNGLTHRENNVLRLVADGLSTREIATELAYSERTIKAVMQELTTRLYLRNRARRRLRGPERLDLTSDYPRESDRPTGAGVAGAPPPFGDSRSARVSTVTGRAAADTRSHQ